MSNKLKRILLLIGIATGLTVLTMLFTEKEISNKSSSGGRISQSFFQAAVNESSTWVFNQATRILNN